MNLSSLIKKPKFLFIAGSIVVVLLLIAAGIRNGSVDVELIVVPEDATITIDGQPAKAGHVTLKAGEHTLKATRQHFTDYEKKVNTQTLAQGQKIYLTPPASTAEALKWLSENSSNSKVREEAGDAAATEAQEDIHNNYPFLKNIPYESINYRVDYSFSNNRTKLSFLVTLMPYAKPGDNAGRKEQLHDFKAEALKYMTEQGIDISKYEINYDPAEAKDL